MNVSNISKYEQWIKRLPIAKNNVIKDAGALNNNCINSTSESTIDSDSNDINSTSESSCDSNDIDKVLYSGEVVKSDMKNFSGSPITEYEFVPSSERDYTVDDAVNYQYNKEFTISLDDLMNGNYDNIKLRDSSAVPQDFIDSLKQNGIDEKSYDSYWSSFYLNGLSDSENLNGKIDYLASGYTAAMQNIEDNFTGDEKSNALDSLKSTFNESTEKIANETAEEIGGFLSNGDTAAIQKIHDSVVKAYNDKVNEYSKYINANKDYAQLDKTENVWLKNDNSYMACQLRKTASTDKTANNESGYYSLDELEATKNVIEEVKSDSKKISCYDDEEKIGFNLSQISLKGEAYSKLSGVSDSLKDSVTKSINDYVNSLPDKLNEQLKKAREGMAEPEKMADLSKKDIFSVYEKVMNTYKVTGNAVKALQEGAAFGKSQHMRKTKESYSNLNRYGKNGSIYWQNFYQNTVKYNSSFGIVLTNDNGYIDKESGIDTLTKNWNNFVSKFTDDSSWKLGTDNISAYA
ncbi:MAG: hypothetical protein LKJ25_11635 [Clostridia bacterium]|jgi:hypothetical protein|nr:hypothetical protein [Clostridia bacterium]